MHPLQQKLYEQIRIRGIRRYESFRDLGLKIDEEHPQKVKHHLAQLEKRGLIAVNWKENTIQLRSKQDSLPSVEAISIPVLGSANCGTATLFAEELPEGVLMLSKNMLKKPQGNVFALRAVGNSMNNAQVGDSKRGIEDGNYVLIDREDCFPKNDDYILSVINGSANIKKFYQDNEMITLLSESKTPDEYPPIFIHQSDADDFMINGKVIDVIKSSR